MSGGEVRNSFLSNVVTRMKCIRKMRERFMEKRNDMQNKKQVKNIMENMRNMDRSNMYKILGIVL